MKTLLLTILSVAIYSNSSAQLKLTENFGGMTAGDLGTQNSWVVAGTGNHAQVTVLANNTGALVYPGYTTGQNYVTANDIDGRDSYKNFNVSVPITANSSTYISFVVRVTSSANTTTQSSTLPSLALRTASGNNLGYFYIANNGTSNLKFGVAKNESGFGDGSYAATNYSFNTTYLIVIRYDVVTGTNNDNMYIWINPSPVTEPTTGSAAQSIIGGSDGTYSGNISALQLFQQDLGSVGVWTSAEAAFDAFRVSNRPVSATAWADLSPAGAPLPVTIGSMKAYEKQAGIQIDWKSYTEINFSHYEIERSSDGRTYSSIGRVAALNAVSGANYSFFDAAPLPGTSFYRLKNLDADSKFEYSNIVRVSLDRNIKDIKLYPNPVTGNYISFQSSDLAKGNYTAKLFDIAGRQVYVQQVSHAGGSINQTIQLPSVIKPGMYTLQLNNASVNVMNKPFMIQ